MRVVTAVLFVLSLLLTAGLPADGARAGMLAPPGPNPNWSKMQKFEWYLGYLASAARTCGSFTDADVLHRLARMSPYGKIGLKTVRGDGFAGPVCGGLMNDARELVADAKDIEAYLETAYNCQDDACYGQEFSSWQTHACAETLKSHLASRAIENDQIGEVFIHNVRPMSTLLEYKARIQLKNCEGSLYVDMKESCMIRKDYIRGDCEIAGVERY